MNRGQKGFWVAMILFTVAAFIPLFFWQQKLTAVKMRLIQMDKATANASSELLALRRAVARTREIHSSVRPAAGQPDPTAEGLMLVEQERRRAKAIKAWVSRVNGRFYREAGLTPDQIANFESAVVAHWLRWSEVLAAARKQGLAAGDPGYLALWKPEAAQFEQEEAAALGPSGFAQLKEYQRIAAPQAATDAVAGMVYDSSEPLTAEQGTALTAMLAQNSASYQKGGAASLGELDTEAVLKEARSILSSSQVAALQTSLTALAGGSKLDALLKAAASSSTASPR